MTGAEYAELAARIYGQQGQAQAQAAQQKGQIWGSTLAGLGQWIGQAPQIAQDRAALVQRQQLQQQLGQQQVEQGGLQLQQERAAVAGQQMLDAAYGKYFQNGALDMTGVSKDLAANGAGHLIPQLMETHAKYQKSVSDAVKADADAETAKAAVLAHTGAQALTAFGTGTPAEAANAAGLLTTLLKDQDARGLIPKGQAAWAVGQMDPSQPETVKRVAQTFVDAPKLLEKNTVVGEGGSLVSPTGQTVFTAPPKAKEAQHVPFMLDGKQVMGSFVPSPEGGKYVYNGEDVTSRVTPSSEKAQEAQHVPLMVDGKQVMGAFVPSPTGGSYFVNGQDVTDRAKPIPAASIQVQNMIQGQKLPASALDDSRPSGAEANKPDPTTGLTPNAIYQGALTYIDTGQYPPIGRGTSPRARAAQEAIQNKAGAIAAGAGMDVPSFRAAYKANAASLGQQQKAADSVQAFMATADRNAEKLDEVLKKIPDTGIPLFNQPLRAFATKVQGDPNLSQFATYLQSVQNEYARIISQPNLSGQLTDNARREAETLLKADATVPQMLAAIQALKTEGNNRLLSLGEQIQRIQKRMTGPGGATTPTPSTGGTIGRFQIIGVQ